MHMGYRWESQKVRYHKLRSRRWWLDNIKIGLREIRFGGIDQIDLARDRDQWRALVNSVINHRLHNWWLLKKGSAPCS
jgi:hypothetical protein